MDYTQALAVLLSGQTNIPQTNITIETPTDASLGDFAFPCFKLAKEYKKAPPLIAQELSVKIMGNKPSWLETAKPTGPYINFFLERGIFAKEVLSDVVAKGGAFGGSDIGAGKKVLVEYSSPNMAKHFHVGNLGTTMIGHSLYKIFTHLGYETTSLNYLGDWGTQYGKLITAFLKWGDREAVEAGGLNELTRLYVKFHEEADQDNTLNDEARAWVVRMQEGNEEGLNLWRWFNEISMVEFKKIYSLMNIDFDIYRGESYYSDKMEAVAKDLQEKGLLIESDGAKIVDLEAYGMPPCLILRRDGGTLYPTRDIAAAIDRYDSFKFDLSLYITGNEQSLHFAQWMKVVELMGYPWAKNMVHIGYGLYSFETGKMSTRRGKVIKIIDLINESVEKTLAIIKEKSPDLPGKEKIAEQVGVGALVFDKLYYSRVKDTVFSWARMLSFDGETGPYVQYTHTRTCSVLEKAGNDEADCAATCEAAAQYLNEPEAFDVLRLLYNYPAAIADAAEKYEPFLVSRHLVALAQAFNVFYHRNIILTDDAGLRRARLALTRAVQTVLRGGLALLGIAAPQAM
jgi:arginyl-tRNA synthetase